MDEGGKTLGMEISWKILAVISALLFLAVAPMPYGFYTFVRIIVCGSAGLMCYQLWNTGYRGTWLWVWGIVAILFNPVAVIHMTKEVWMAVDALAGGVFAFSAYQKYKEEQHGKGS